MPEDDICFTFALVKLYFRADNLLQQTRDLILYDVIRVSFIISDM